MTNNAGIMNVPPFPPEYRASGLLLHVTALPSLAGAAVDGLENSIPEPAFR